jgi:hypothetical protein
MVFAPTDMTYLVRLAASTFFENLDFSRMVGPYATKIYGTADNASPINPEIRIVIAKADAYRVNSCSTQSQVYRSSEY